jgi:hypothetical protein
MSLLEVNRVCYRIAHDPGFLAALRADPRAALAKLDLTRSERTALLEGDVGALYCLGAQPLLLVRLAVYGLFGLTPRLYTERVRAAAVSGLE